MTIILFIFLKLPDKLTVKKQLENIDLSEINKLMIVAHPDDETIWGGAHLLNDNYLVVCITCGRNQMRVKEIKKALDYSNDKLIMLNFPDKVFGKRSDWAEEKPEIISDLRTIINYKKWDLIVTHNPKGEYGHEHHKMTSRIVTDISTKKLYYFGKYYPKNKLKKKSMIDKDLLVEKTKMLKIYKSQSFINNKFGHMYPYEKWVKYGH